MLTKPTQWWKLVGIVMLAVILDGIAHGIAPEIADSAMNGASGEVTVWKMGERTEIRALFRGNLVYRNAGRRPRVG